MVFFIPGLGCPIPKLFYSPFQSDYGKAKPTKNPMDYELARRGSEKRCIDI